MLNVMRIAEKYDASIEQYMDGKQFTKDNWRTVLILIRFLIRHAMENLNSIKSELRYYRRQRRKLQGQDVAFILLDAKILEREAWEAKYKNDLISYGHGVIALLDTWQESGATQEELFNLCNARKAEREASREHPEGLFSELMFIFNLDYPADKSEWIEFTTDAPFTHAVKGCILDTLSNSKAGRMAAREAMCAVFPDMQENTYHLRLGEDGKEYVYGSNGECLGVLED